MISLGGELSGRCYLSRLQMKLTFRGEGRKQSERQRGWNINIVFGGNKGFNSSPDRNNIKTALIIQTT